MPALRRRDRDGKSRTGTPFTSISSDPAAFAADAKKEKVQSSLDAWVEPALANPTASFEEAGFSRSILFQNQQPVGEFPSAKMKQRARALEESNGRRSLLGRKSNTFGDEPISTPEMTPARELEREGSERQEEEEEVQAALPTQDEDEDDDYVPKKSKAKAQSAKTPVRGKTPSSNKTSAHKKTPLKNGTSTVPSSTIKPLTQIPTTDDLDDASKQRVQMAVNHAIERANTQKNQPIGIALREMFQVGLKDTRYAKILSGVMHRKATPDEESRFRTFVKTVKKRVKRETKEKALRRTEAEEESILRGESDPISPHPEDEVAPSDSASNADFTSRPTPGQNASLAEGGLHNSEDAPSKGLHPLTNVPAFSAAGSPSPSARMPSKSPRKLTLLNGNTTPAPQLDTMAESSTAVPTPAVKTPESGAPSDSDLSDVNEEIVQNGPPEPVQANGSRGTSATLPVSKKGRNAALARAGKKAKALAATKGRYEKRQPPTLQELAEQEEIHRKRQVMAEQQPSRMEYNPPVSDIRFDDEMLETESLTSSQIAVGPPVDANRPRRAGRAPRNSNGLSLHTGNTKRARGDEFGYSSPLPESAITTRPSTPVIPPPNQPNKRVKLNNGQAARTKRSPIKNRDGPIAGIAHTGGGGSRHFGPDDNEPGSPPESDDLCSACKGAGEFVCCEHCPRVFHFLCCDPPLLHAPKGSFDCYECSAKLKPAEESAAEAHPYLGPLFKSLDTINTRAFALPADIQNHFENVAARPDGSYHEESRKLPLAKSSGYGYQKPDYFRTVDADGKTILCCKCGLSSGGKRAMLKCDFCHAFWHLDCCDPPLANPPNISLDASQRDAWKCPQHVDHDLRSGLVLQNDLNESDDDAQMVNAGQARILPRRVRKLKNPSVVEPTFSRGMRNNGLIEIVNDPDDDTDGEGNYVFPRDRDESKDLNSKIYRVPEKGIILDFIGKVKSGRVERQKKVQQTAKAATGRRNASLQYFGFRPIEQQQAALSLAKLANQEKVIGLNEMDVDALILNLTAEAPQEVVTSIDSAPLPPPSDDERAQLLVLQQLIARRLNG